VSISKVKRLTQVKSTSVNLEFRHLKAAFETAVKWAYLSKNPFRGIKQVKVKGKNLPKYLTKEQVAVLLATIPEGEFKNLISFYLYTGCRRQEVLNLGWDDIDLEARRLTIRVTKSGESRAIPISTKLLEVISKMERNGSKLFSMSPWYVTHLFKRYLKTANIQGSDSLKLHSLRHTFASHLVMSGVDLYTVAKLLGHSSVAVTQMYAHLAPDYLKVSVERLQY
jgi:integrase